MPLKMYEEPMSGVKQIVAVAAGKGGVGKSTVTVGLAHALVAMGFRVGILDADIYGPSIRKMVGDGELPYKEGDKLFPALSQGIKMMSMAFFRKEGQSDAVRAPVASGFVTQFLKEIQWGQLDFLLIDFPPGTGDIQLTLCQQAKLRGAVMVTTPQEVAVMDVRKAINLFQKVHVPILGIVENMSYYLVNQTPHYLFGQGGGKRLANEVSVPLLADIPIDPEIGKALEEGRPFSHPSFVTLAKLLVGQTSERHAISFYQKDRHHLVVAWENGETKTFRFAELQKKCPCAACDKPQVDEEVGATSVEEVGRYALKIKFTSGCSSGLYPFEQLRTSH